MKSRSSWEGGGGELKRECSFSVRQFTSPGAILIQIVEIYMYRKMGRYAYRVKVK